MSKLAKIHGEQMVVRVVWGELFSHNAFIFLS